MAVGQKKKCGQFMIYEISDLGFSYGKHRVLNDVSLTLEERELLCVLGKNGSGKSTLFYCLLGLKNTYDGSIRLLGTDLKRLKEREIASVIGYVPQNCNSAFDFTVFEYVLMGCAAHVQLFSYPSKQDKDAAMNALETMDILNLKDRSITELSGGERQQAAIARALAASPQAILFDEPTAHLDYCNQIKVLKIIKRLHKSGYTVCMTTHDPNHALLLDGNVALIDDEGHVQKGNADDMVSEGRLGKLFGQNMNIIYVDELKRKVCLYPNL